MENRAFIHQGINATLAGFLSLDCGGKQAYSDDTGLQWTPDSNFTLGGSVANITVVGEARKQYQTLRYFPPDNKKYCYTLNVKARTRYLVRATFLYGNFDNSNVFPKFDISLGATHWSTIVISDIDMLETHELILLAMSSSISVCLSNASTGQPFISTLELRQFNGSMYYTNFEAEYFLKVSARINFGATNNDSIRFPDDPYDRIWESDAVKRANFLVDMASGTSKIHTRRPIDTGRDERPPEKVMQTAVVGENGTLAYRTNLDGFPGFGWAFSYFAEIQDLDPMETRKFSFVLPNVPDYNNLIINVQENAQGSYKLYEPGYTNVSLPFVVSFKFVKTSDSSRGPILNAMEINKYVEINYGTEDGGCSSYSSSHSFISMLLVSCIIWGFMPQLWELRIRPWLGFAAAALTSLITLYSSADWAREGGDPCLPVPWTWVHCSLDAEPRVTGIILSAKNLTGRIPLQILNLTGLTDLWLDHNSLNGSLPDFGTLVNLKTLHLEYNQLSGSIPISLANLPNLKQLYVQNNMLSGTVAQRFLDKDLIFNIAGGSARVQPIGSSRVCLILVSICYNLNVRIIMICEPNFHRVIAFEGRECARLPCFNPPFVDTSVGPASRAKQLDWIMRLKLAEDAAKGIEYLHTGCNPSIIHRDLKSSNILLDKQMRAKVSDFGLSRLAADGTTHGSSIVRGTVGYLDPEYYVSQQLTEKSDVYSFGVVLLEIISGREAISNESFGVDFRNIVQWARFYIEKGDIQSIIDPALGKDFNIQSVWKIAEKAMFCVQPYGKLRPAMSDVVKEIQEAIEIEKESPSGGEEELFDMMSRHSRHSSILSSPLDYAASDPSFSVDESIVLPSAR